MSNVVRLHLNKREAFFGVPLYVLGVGIVISIVIALIFQRLGSVPGSEEYLAGARGNNGLLFSVAGYLGYLGVQAVSTTFPLALALGTTRRAYVAGTALANALLAGYVTAVLAVLLCLELLTDHWGFGLHLTDVFLLGSGHLGWLIVISFLGLFGILCLGGLFAAAWVRYGSRGAVTLSLALALGLALVLLLLAPKFGEIFLSFRPWMAVVTAIAATALMLVGTWLLMRRTSVR